MVDGRKILFVDTPGIGEVGTHAGYRAALLRWCLQDRKDIRLCLLVLQADGKGHAEELSVLNLILPFVPGMHVRIVLSQVDKMKPLRQPLPGSTWEQATGAGGIKVGHIREKIDLTASQFGCPQDHIVPVSRMNSFNKDSVVAHVTGITQGG